MKYTSDVARLCATHYSNARPKPQDQRTADAERYAGLVLAENLITYYGTAQERIERGYRKALERLVSA